MLMFTDIEGSTPLLRELGRQYEELLVQHHEIIQHAATANNGEIFGSEGDGLALMFSTATDAIAAALQSQRDLSSRSWPGGKSVKVRMGIHVGEVVKTSVSYVGVALHEVARLMAVGHGGQVLVSDTAARLAQADLPPSATLRLLGRYKLRDYVQPERVHQLCAPGLASSFPPLRTQSVSSDLPLRSTSFVGRHSELETLEATLTRSRVVSLVGAGGSGKTRLALELADRVADRFPAGVIFVPLASVSSPARVDQALATAVFGADALAEEAQGGGATDADAQAESLMQRLVRQFDRDAALVIIDNCEHVLDASADLVSRLTSAMANMSVVATSRERLRIEGEAVLPLLPLAVPAEDARTRSASCRRPTPCNCSSIECGPSIRASRSPRTTPPPSPGSVVAWTESRWPSRSPPPSCSSSPSSTSTASAISCAWPARPARPIHGTRPCTPRSTGATTCSTRRLRPCSAGSRCSPVASPSTPPSRSAPSRGPASKRARSSR